MGKVTKKIDDEIRRVERGSYSKDRVKDGVAWQDCMNLLAFIKVLIFIVTSEENFRIDYGAMVFFLFLLCPWVSDKNKISCLFGL